MPSSTEAAGPVDRWAASGAKWLTGHPDGPPLDVAGAPADQVAEQLHALVPAGEIDIRLLGERAAIAGWHRRGRASLGEACRMVPASDGWVALSLPRRHDLELLPALIEATVSDPWVDVGRWLRTLAAQDAVERARLLGLAASVVPPGPRPPRRPAVLRTDGGPRRPSARPLVVDLSSLWAGPLCAHLLGLRGADVVKVESVGRPDGARGGPTGFYDLLHAGHRSVALDFTTYSGREHLRQLVARAGVVIEASRPRALRQLGVDADAAVAAGAVWVSITAYGRADRDDLLIGFGDDVAAGAGLVARDDDGPLFAGDALADPLTGVQAAFAAAAALGGTVGCLLDVSMHDTARAAAASRPVAAPSSAAQRPWARTPAAAAAALGADTAAVLAALDSGDGIRR